jgi:phytoene dehydrogenase-like protein
VQKHLRKAYVVGSGANGLTAGIELARAGYQTTLIEAQQEVSGGIHSAQLTLPGFVHDVCSAIHPLALSSPAFQSYPLHEHGLEWIQPPIPLAHPFENGEAAVLYRSIEQTVQELGDGEEYRRIAKIFVRQWPKLMNAFLKPMLSVTHPLLMVHFGWHGAQPALWLWRKAFKHEAGRALLAGAAAHSALPLSAPGSAAFGLVLGLAAHAVGWPLPRGGSQSIANALASYFQSLGGTIVTGERVHSFSELHDAHLVLCNLGTNEFMRVAGARLPDS